MPSTAPVIPGLTYLPDYLTAEQHDDFLAVLDTYPWLTDLARRVQHYGYRYDYKARTVAPEMYLGPLPDWAAELAQRLHAEGWFASEPDQLIVNEYEPGQGISKHVDCVPCFSDTVVSISLGSTCVMELARGKVKVPLLLRPRSAIILQEDARYDWTHAIPARLKDTFEGEVHVRARRVSLTFRKVLLEK
jgi:alkylated DNA repair dioxygenase AlkB